VVVWRVWRTGRIARPASCPHQMPAAVEVLVLEMRRARPYWGARRIAFEVARAKVCPCPSESAVYRALVRAGVIEGRPRRGADRRWKRWERGRSMELWQMDLAAQTCGRWFRVHPTPSSRILGLVPGWEK
jgi:hypothetical protein